MSKEILFIGDSFWTAGTSQNVDQILSEQGVLGVTTQEVDTTDPNLDMLAHATLLVICDPKLFDQIAAKHPDKTIKWSEKRAPNSTTFATMAETILIALSNKG